MAYQIRETGYQIGEMGYQIELPPPPAPLWPPCAPHPHPHSGPCAPSPTLTPTPQQPHMAHAPPGWDVLFNFHFDVQSHLAWVKSHFVCSPPHTKKIFTSRGKNSPQSHEATPVSINKVLYESPITEHTEKLCISAAKKCTSAVFWWLISCHLVIGFGFSFQIFENVARTYECNLPFCECRWSSRDIGRTLNTVIVLVWTSCTRVVGTYVTKIVSQR